MRDSGPERGTARRAAVPRVRAAVDGDARALSALMGSVYDEGRWFVGDGPPRPDVLRRRLRSLDPKRELFLVAELRGDGAAGARIVGWIEAHRFAPMRMDHVASFTLAVGAEARGRGVGRTLLRALGPWARRVGVRKLRLDVRADNVAARALYESEGFVVEGIERAQVRRSPDDDASDDAMFEDNVIMARFV